jgi:hypothetical protein
MKKTPTKIIFSIVICLLYPMQAFSEICQKLEFAELESLSKEELLRLRCDYYDNELQAIDLEYKSVISGKNGVYWESASTRCDEELTRMDRVLTKKLNLKPRDNNPYDLMLQIANMCYSK